MAQGFDVWWDVALMSGQDYDRVTERALHEAGAVVVLWSKRSVDSRWVRAEATVAQRNGSLVPVMIDDCQRPVMFELTQSADLRGWAGDLADPRWLAFGSDVATHIGSRAARLAGNPPEPAASKPVAPAPARSVQARRQVAILSAALVGDSEADPEDWHEATEGFRKLVADKVAAFDGKVLPGAGGSLTAVFGADATREDDALRAVLAGRALHAAMPGFKLAGAGPFLARIGIDCGPVVIGGSGALPAGPAMDGSAQLQTQAEPGSLVISVACARLAGGYFQLERLGARAFTVTGEADTHTRFDLSQARGLSPFVGRSTELNTLIEALDKSAAGNGQVIGIMAEAGAGKSRLCFEFAEHCRHTGAQFYRGSATQQGRNVPLLAMIEMLKDFFGIDARDPDAAARDRIEARLTQLDPRLATALPTLFDFLGVPDPERPMPPLDPEARQRQLVALVRHLFMLASADHPLVMLIEDLHWIDDASRAFLEAMVEQQSGTRYLILLNYRPEFRADWMQHSACRQISLLPLGETAVDALLAELLGSDPSVTVLRQPIAALTKGNPYFIEEILQTLVETGHIVGDRGAWKLVGSFDRLEVPATVKAVVEARIDRLGEREKNVLQVASVIGGVFSEPLLAAATAMPMAELAAALQALRRNEFIVEQSVFPVTEYGFKHPLTLEVTHSTLVKGQRRAINAAVARGIEAEDADRLDQRAATLAMHWEEAGEALIAAGWHQKAAERVARTDFPTSAWHWERVRVLARTSLPDPAAFGFMVAASIQLLNMNYRVGIDRAAAEAVLAEAQGLATAAGLPDLALMLSICFSRVLCGAADVKGYVALASENHAAAMQTDDFALKVIANILYVDALVHSCRFPQALELLETLLVTYPVETAREYWITGFNPHSFFAFMNGVTLSWMGRLEEAEAQLVEARTLAFADGTPEVAGWCSFQLATVGYLMGDFAKSLENARAIEEISDTLGSPLLASYRHIAYTWAHLGRGDHAAAHPYAEAAVDVFKRIEQHWAGVGATLMARVHFGAGRYAEALEWADDAIRQCADCEVGQYELQALGVRVLILMRRDRDVAAAEHVLDRVEAVLTRTGAEALRPWALEWRAELAKLQGDEPGSRGLYEQAAALHLTRGAAAHAIRLKSQAA